MIAIGTRTIAAIGVVLLSALSGCAPSQSELNAGLAGAADSAQGCVNRVATGIATDIEQINYVVQDCLGEAYSPQAKVARTHAAILMLANYGTRSIEDFSDDDPESVTAEALLLKHRVQKAMAELTKIRQAPEQSGTEATLRKLYPQYRPLATRERGDVQLYGVLRAALTPAVRRTKSTVSAYLKASAGGAGGVLSEVIRRRALIHKKIKEVRRTLSLGEAAIFDTRCVLRSLDKQNGIDHQIAPTAAIAGDSAADAGSRTEVPPPSCPSDYPPNLEQPLWDATNQWLGEIMAKLDELAARS